MPCVKAEAAAERQRFIAAHRVDVDRFAGVSDPARWIELFHQHPPYDPLVRDVRPSETLPEMVARLDDAATKRLVESTVRALAEGRDDGEEGASLARTLACLTRAELDELQLALVGCGDPHPSVVFRDASERVTRALATLLEAPDVAPLLASHTLSALAWTHHPHAVALFARWGAHPPSWAPRLHLAPAGYARDGGWELEGGVSRALAGEPCHALVTGGSSDRARALTPTDQRCRCGRALTLLLDVRDVGGLLPWIGWAGERLIVPTCDVCVCFATLFHTVDDAGVIAELGDRALSTAAAGADLPLPAGTGLVLGAPRSPYHAADWLLELRASQLGGYPGWIQHPAYPACAACGRTMAFVGQLEGADVVPYGEGTFYGFACAPCSIVATCFQQT